MVSVLEELETGPSLPGDSAAQIAIEGVSAFDPNGPAARGPIRVIDLFAGCGGLSTGFEIVGRSVSSYRLAGAVELNQRAAETYGRNLPITPLIEDLAAVAAESDIQGWFRRSFSDLEDGPLVLVGGPPCQGFSAHRKKDGEDLADLRNSLVADYGRIAVALMPDVIVMENVPELLSRRHWGLFEVYRDMLAEAGYTVRAQIHNLAGFGVPQERFRALVVAARHDFEMPTPFLGRDEFRTVRQAVGHLPRVRAGEVLATDDHHRSAGHASSTLDVIRQVPHDGGRRPAGVGPACLQDVDGFRDVYGRLYWDKPSNTITGSARNPASGRFSHPEQDRGLTIREAALLQGFPPAFTFAGSFDNRFSQIGNAVPPIFATHLAAHLLTILARPDVVRTDTVQDVTRPQSNSFSSGIAWLKWRA